YWADQIKETFTKIEDKEKAVVIFSAHSLPKKIIAAGDPYVEQSQHTADLIAAAAPLPPSPLFFPIALPPPSPFLFPSFPSFPLSLRASSPSSSFFPFPLPSFPSFLPSSSSFSPPLPPPFLFFPSLFFFPSLSSLLFPFLFTFIFFFSFFFHLF
ncbi:ferrochelatase, partial [Bacillus sp. JEM-1]|uniref:ferrochelatase n=1 Tax=Bacillus sp. JEM-1 TaxID=1977090 RepID=UPI001F0A5851